MEFGSGNMGTLFRTSLQSLFAIEPSYHHSRIIKELAERLSKAQRKINHWLSRTAYLCAVALCLSTAAAQDNADIREKTHQLEQLRSAGKFQEAVPIAQEVLKYCEKNYGPDHPETADSLSDLAYLYGGMGERAKALPLYQRALKIREKALGQDHPYTAILLNNLAETYRESGDFAKAEPLYKRAIKIWETKLGAKHPNTLSGLSNLALLYQDKGDSAKAEPLYVRVLKIREETLGPDNPQVA